MASLKKSASEERDRAATESKTASTQTTAHTAAALQQKVERLSESGEQAAKNLKRDLRNAPGASTASPEATAAASRAIDDLATTHQKQLDQLAAAGPGLTPEAALQRDIDVANTATAQRAEREQAMRILTDTNLTPEQRAEQLRDLARDAAETLGIGSERIRPAPVSPEQKPALDAALGPEIASALNEGAHERMVGALQKDLAAGAELTRLTQQLGDELLQSRTASVRFGSEAIEQLSRGNAGERLAADALAKQGYEIASYKPDVAGTNQGGVDIVALKRDDATQEERLHLIDNKALTRPGNVTSVSALTTNLQQNIGAVRAEFEKLRDSADSTARQRDVAARVLDAIANNRITLAVTNANIARDGQFTTDTAGKAAELDFVDVVKVNPAEKIETDSTVAVDEQQREEYRRQAKEPAAAQTRESSAAAVEAAAKSFAAAWQAQHAAEVEALAAARRAEAESRQREEARQRGGDAREP